MATEAAHHHPDRRAVLAVLAVLTASAFCGATGASGVSVAAARSTMAAFVACCRTEDGTHAAALIDGAARLLLVDPLDGRGHGAAINPAKTRAVVFARRPGRFAIVLDLEVRRRVAAFTPPADRHFYGHGLFSADGRLLFATENDFDADRGVLGIYDATDGFRRIGEFETGGIGPHEALLLRDGRTIALANGGISTHPDFPRQKLNLATMAPSIALIDSATGDIVATATLAPARHQLSIRHLAEADDGDLWFGGQYEGDKRDNVPLVGRFARARGIGLVDAPDALYRGMKQYVGSVAANSDGTRIATTSPRGGQVVIWDAATCQPIEIRVIHDVCGAAPLGAGFALTDGGGGLTLDARRGTAPVAWDNHLQAI